MSDDYQSQIDEHVRAVEGLRLATDLLDDVVRRIVSTIGGGGVIYVLGNGGSAADAQHIAAELLGRFKRNRRALPAVALTTDTSVLTAVGNDLGAEEVFRRQVEGLVSDKDLVWALSVSGSSPNVLRALEAARAIGATVVGFTSRSGVAMAEICDVCLKADTEASDRVQEIHELAYHLICDRVEQAFA